MQYIKYFSGGKIMGCLGSGKDGGFGCEGLLILAAIFFFCFNGNSSSGCGLFSNLFDDCDWLIWVAIILLLLYVCNNSNENSCD